jgi:LmbE family N-acetylglucosaminyl deacetylase
MNPYLEFVQSIETGIRKAKGLAVSGSRQSIESDSKVLLFSPHPDDECIVGLLPLRLMRETGHQIINVPVTFGSNVERQAERSAELDSACGYLGWDIFRDMDNLESMEASDVVRALSTFQPDVIFMPHSKDWNSRHISTHFLVVDALKKMGPDFSCLVIETQFWGAMDDPNLLVEGDAIHVADLVAATSLHAGEVARNPYHLLLPAWMQDSAGRGSELIGGQGSTAPDFGFATLYRLRKWQDGEFVRVLKCGTTLPINADINELTRFIED